MEESSPKDYEQLSVNVENKTRVDQISVSSKSRAGLRNRTFRRGWFNDAAEQIVIPGLTPHELRRAGAIGTALQRRAAREAHHVAVRGSGVANKPSYSCGLTKKNEIVHSFS